MVQTNNPTFFDLLVALFCFVWLICDFDNYELSITPYLILVMPCIQERELSVSILCITEEFLNLSVFAWYILNLSGFLVTILCFLSFSGNICFVFGFFLHFSAKFRHKISLLSFNVFIPNFARDFLYQMYPYPKINLTGAFCTL